MVWLSRKELKERVLNKNGEINLGASLADFAAYVGSKKTGNSNGFEQPTYISLRGSAKVTIGKAVKEINTYGIGEFGMGRGYTSMPCFGEKRAEDLCRVLKNYRLLRGEIKKYRWKPGKFD